MPRICEFFGIVISMYYREAHGVPHFHARWRVLRLVREWAALNPLALEDNWIRAQQRLPMRPVRPLDYH